jgi:hypothetical protein
VGKSRCVPTIGVLQQLTCWFPVHFAAWLLHLDKWTRLLKNNIAELYEEEQ